MEKNAPILVMGAGSIGERHISILQKMGYSNIWVFRQRNLPLRNIQENSIQTFTDLKQIHAIKPLAAIICTPTSQHLDQAICCAERGIPMLLEKPLANRLYGIQHLKDIVTRNHVYAQVAYMLRYHPFFQKIKDDIVNRKMGNLIHMQTYWGEYLPDWHPWEDYRKSYAAQKELGGGAALTLSHDIDLVNWLSGSEAKKWFMIKNYNSALDINVESGADTSIIYQNGITAHCHVNFHERIPKRSYHFVFEEGSIELNYIKATLTTSHFEKVTVRQLIDFDRNQLYEAQILHFFENINDHNRDELSLKNLRESEVILSICL